MWISVFWCENNEFCVFVGVKKSGFNVFLVSVGNGAGVNKMTNITYAVYSAWKHTHQEIDTNALQWSHNWHWLEIWKNDSENLAHRCTIFLCIWDGKYYDKYRNQNMNNKDHLVGQLTINNNESKLLMKLVCILLCIDLFHRIMEIMSDNDGDANTI